MQSSKRQPRGLRPTPPTWWHRFLAPYNERCEAYCATFDRREYYKAKIAIQATIAERRLRRERWHTPPQRFVKRTVYAELPERRLERLFCERRQL